MTTKLHLEYSCTPAEMQEAESLSIRKQLGGGSKWRTWLVLSIMMTVALAGLYFAVVVEVPVRFRPYFIAGVVILFLYFFIRQRVSRRRQAEKKGKLEVTEKDVTIINGDSRVSIAWQGFKDCFESSNVFVLLDQPGTLLIVVPKRIFPDESARDWFRSLANRRQKAEEFSTEETSPVTSADSLDGIAVNFKLGYGDYLSRVATSWRTRGFFIGIFALIGGDCIYMGIHPDPEAVNSPAKVFFCYLLPFLVIMLPAMALVATFWMWWTERKYLLPQQLILEGEGIKFVGRDENGFLPWTTYSHFKENRWTFFIWKKGGGAWLMLPKRAFNGEAAIERCRPLLKSRLRQSRWFFR